MINFKETFCIPHRWKYYFNGFVITIDPKQNSRLGDNQKKLIPYSVMGICKKCGRKVVNFPEVAELVKK